MVYPYLEISTASIRQNARAVCDFCSKNGIDVAGVIKFSDGCLEMSRTYYEGGCKEIASSRVMHLKELRQSMPEIPTLLIRMPMASEIEETVRWCDTSFCTSSFTLQRLEDAAAKQNKRHGVLLVLDVGDLREGVISEIELCELAQEAESLPHIYLRGIASTFGCFGSVLPDHENLTRLALAAKQVENLIGRKLETISGGSSTSLMPLSRGEVPAGINHFRVGGFIANPIGMKQCWSFTIPGITLNTFFLRAQVIECNEKPTCPEKQSGHNWSGDAIEYLDLGIRRRAIVALGEADVGDVTKLIPVDEGIRIMGGSSDHLILDIADAKQDYQMGDIITFRMYYGALLHAFTSRLVGKTLSKI